MEYHRRRKVDGGAVRLICSRISVCFTNNGFIFSCLVGWNIGSKYGEKDDYTHMDKEIGTLTHTKIAYDGRRGGVWV